MNEQLQQALAALLNKTVAGVEAGASFLQTELPDVIQQLLTWKLASSILTAIICAISIALIFVTFKAINRGVKSEQGLWHDYDSPFNGLSFCGFLFYILGSVGCIPLAFELFSNAGVALQIWLAPKIYLIEYAASLAK